MKKTYAHHTPTLQTVAVIRDLRKAFSDLHELVEASAPPSRERAIALTELETSAMWAIKAIVINDPAAAVEA